MTVNPGEIKHGILQVLDKGGTTFTILPTRLRAKCYQFATSNLINHHLPALEAEGWVTVEIHANGGGRAELTDTGRSMLRDLNQQLHSPDKAWLVPSRTTSFLGTGNYDGAELRVNPGITEDRLVAFKLPSVFMGRRVWPDGRSEPLDVNGR